MPAPRPHHPKPKIACSPRHARAMPVPRPRHCPVPPGAVGNSRQGAASMQKKPLEQTRVDTRACNAPKGLGWESPGLVQGILKETHLSKTVVMERGGCITATAAEPSSAAEEGEPDPERSDPGTICRR
eukprot:gene13869-biopygen5064